MDAFAATLARFWAVTTQWLEPVFLGKLVGRQVFVSVTLPCVFLNATGITTSLRPVTWGSSVIWPKYWPFATSGALIVIQSGVGARFTSTMGDADLGPFGPGGPL